jgi:hypothetical protein
MTPILRTAKEHCSTSFWTFIILVTGQHAYFIHAMTMLAVVCQFYCYLSEFVL